MKLREPGVFEKSYRAVHKNAKRSVADSIRVIVEVRRAALVAQIKRMQKGGK